MGAYIINIPDSVDRVVYINVDPMDGKTYIASYSVDELTPYTEHDTNEAYQRGYETAKHECEDCTKNVDLNAIRKEAYEQGRKDGKIEGQAEMWLATKTIYGNPADCALTNAEVKEIFGDDYELYSIPHIFSAAEAIDRIRAWERKPKPDPYEDCIRGYIYDLCDRHDLRIDQLANVVNRMRRNDA